jgi:hypothetical protein
MAHKEWLSTGFQPLSWETVLWAEGSLNGAGDHHPRRASHFSEV